jgi:predicted O-methyltransferase YrrM
MGKLVSVEDRRQWYATVTGRLSEAQLSPKVEYQYIPCECREIDEPAEHPYASAARAMADGSLDFALVDGNIRATCMRAILPKIKSGGLLILDNANRYVPNYHLGRHTTVHEPRSEPRTTQWARLMHDLKDWRWINTTNGIWDTRLWIKPAAC